VQHGGAPASVTPAADATPREPDVGSPELIRLLLADQQSLFREAIRTGLEAEADLVVVGEARNGPDAVREAERTSPDVAIVDIALPITGGAHTCAHLLQRVPQCRVLVLGTDEDYRSLIEVLDEGAAGFLTKEAPLSDLIEATRAVHRGETLVPSRMLGPLLAALLRRRKERDSAYRRISHLTRREREVLALLSEGADNDGIAKALVISPQTARTHIQNILVKLSVHSRLEAAAFVTQNGILPDLVASGG
jgi:DNA-binding NarL/FixJ family response regulator